MGLAISGLFIFCQGVLSNPQNLQSYGIKRSGSLKPYFTVALPFFQLRQVIPMLGDGRGKAVYPPGSVPRITCGGVRNGGPLKEPVLPDQA